MFGYVEWTEEKRRLSVTEREILQVRFRCVSIPRRTGTPSFLLRRRCETAARMLHKEGITRVVFQRDFDWVDAFAKLDIRPADPLAVYRVLAPELVQNRLAQQGQRGRGAAVAVCARRLTEDVRRTVTDLCIRNRYVLLYTADHDEVFCRRLRREYGVPLVLTEDRSRLAGAAVMVRFSPEAEAAAGQDVLDLFPGGNPIPEMLHLSPEKEARLPPSAQRLQLLAALYAAGVIRVGDIRVMATAERENGPSVGEKL